MITVQLTWPELQMAAIIGVGRRIVSLRGGLNKNKHADKSDWQTDIDGAAAEMAVAKHRGVYWDGSINSFKRPDLNGGIQVRSTQHRNGHLIIRPNDAAEAETYVFVITRAPFFDIIGTLPCKDAKVDEFWREDAWWVPQSRLFVAAELIA